MTDEESQFISVYTLTNRFEADLLTDALQHEEIPFLLRSFVETPYNGLFVSQRGWGYLMVPEEFASKARNVVKHLIDDLESKKLYANPGEIDPLLWERLREADPESICRNAQVRYDSKDAAYVVPFLNAEFFCLPNEERIEARSAPLDYKLDFEFYLVMLHYLLEAQTAALSGKWISEKDIPGGQLFFRGPHKFPFDPLLELFGSRPDVFSRASERLGATRANMGDVAYRFWAFPRVPLLFVLWEGDDEFKADLHIRFDGSIGLQLQALDTIWAMVNVICRSLRKASRAVLEDGCRS